MEPTFKWSSRPILSIVGDLVRKNGLTGMIGLTRIDLRAIQITYVHRYTVSRRDCFVSLSLVE